MANYDICMMREKLMTWTKEAMNGDPSGISAQELGEVVDMIKDTYEMEYYFAKRKYYEEKIGAMEDDEGNERFKMGRSGMMRVLPEMDHRWNPDEYDVYARMEMSTSAKMHIGETIATLRDMWHDADPDLREKMKKDFSALLQEMN